MHQNQKRLGKSRLNGHWTLSCGACGNFLSYDASRIASRDLIEVKYKMALLSRRVFRQITDSALLGVSHWPVSALCTANKCSSCLSSSPSRVPVRCASSSSSTRWKSRQGKDFFAKEAKVQGLKSRAAFKLLEVRSSSRKS